MHFFKKFIYKNHLMNYRLFLLGKRSEKVGYSADLIAFYDAVSWVIYVLKISIFMFKKVHYLFGGSLTFFWGRYPLTAGVC